MAVVIPDKNGHMPPCSECGEPSDYRCDVCMCYVCCDCIPYLDSECPNEFCEDCIQPTKARASDARPRRD